jgi:hypothetical protein
MNHQQHTKEQTKLRVGLVQIQYQEEPLERQLPELPEVLPEAVF